MVPVTGGYMAKKYLFIALFLINALVLFSQPYSTGAILDPEVYAQVPQKAATRDLISLPRSVTLKTYAPYPGDQGPFSTCGGWASAYAARTIAESIGLRRLDRTLTTSNAFSPAFVYRSISNDPTCLAYTFLKDALDLMKNQGIPKRLSTEDYDFRGLPPSSYASSIKYPIKDYARIITYSGGETADSRIRAVKRALAEGKPVLIGMPVYSPSFGEAQGRWIPQLRTDRNLGGHFMCVVGYDDDMYGGAFEIQNSWGTRWGNDGYIWVTYTDFGVHVTEAYELIENMFAYQETAEFSGSVFIETKDANRPMEVEFVSDGYYRTKTSHPSGTLFRYLMNCDKPAYLYAFAANDVDRNSYYRIFPQDGVLAVLDYRQNTFAFPPDRPGEIDWMELYGTPGAEYLVVLFSKQPLDIDAIGRRFMGARGNFAARVESAVGANFIRPQLASYQRDSIAYTAQSSNQNAVFGLLLAIDHR
jgi:hypothetical protein